jgi:phospholipid transport system substrate-binding protein
MISIIYQFIFRVCFTACLALAGGIATPAFATPVKLADETPDTRIRIAVAEFIELFYSDNSEPPSNRTVRTVFERHFVFESTTRRAVGPGWRQFSPEEQRRTVDLFTDVVIQTYTRRLTVGERPEIVIGTTQNLAAERASVDSTVIYEGTPYAVVYRLEKNQSGWRIYDLVIEGVSLIANYRAQFLPFLMNGGSTALLSSLENKIASGNLYNRL